MKLKYILFLFFLSFASCDIIQNDATPDKNIYKIIDNSSFEKTFFANKLIQTSDGGYLILGADYEDVDSYVWLTPYLVKLNSEGNLVWETELGAPYVNPVGIWENNGLYYIICMDQTSLGTHILSVDANTSAISLVQSLDIMYPLALAKTPDNGVAIQGYNRNSRQTSLTKLSQSFEIQWTNTFPLIENSEEQIIGHISKRGKQYPFFVGYSGENTAEHYFLNGFYRYSFSLIFASSAGAYTGVVNGFRYEGAVSSMCHNTGNTYFMSMYYKGNNYFLPKQELNTAETASIEALDGAVMAKLQEDAIVQVKKIDVAGKEMVLYAANSKNNQILLYLYDATTGEFVLSREISDYYPIQINDIIQTADGGVAIIGQTIVTGRFPRIFFLKLSDDKFSLVEED